MFLSLMQTFVMMAGEINHQDTFMKPYMADKLPYPLLTYWVFIWFILLVPILLMNLLVSTNKTPTQPTRTKRMIISLVSDLIKNHERNRTNTVVIFGRVDVRCRLDWPLATSPRCRTTPA